jgi:amino-acid N-acetyltransferase
MEVTGSAVLSPLTLVRRLDGLTIRGISATAGLAPEIAERQRTLAVERLRAAGQSAAIEARQVRAFSRGSFVFLAAHGDGGSGGFSGLGAREAEVEQIVDAAVDGLLEFARTDAGCDPHLADQLVVPLALSPGTSRLTTSRVTPHLLTAVSLVQQFLGCPVQVRGEVGSAGSVTIEGIGLHTPKSSGAVGAAPREQGGGTHASSAERPMQPAVVRKARAADGLSIQRLLAHFAARGEVLHRTLDEVYEHLRDFVVGEADGQIVGVCALWLYWEDLAEIRSLAVHEAHAGRGLGTALVDACVDEAAHLGIRRVFALTYRPGFFERLGFRTLDKRELPQKIWKDCIRCARFSCCDEVALIRDVEPARAV